MIKSVLPLLFWTLIIIASISQTSTAQTKDPFPAREVTTHIDLGCNPNIRNDIPKPHDRAHLLELKKKLDPDNCGVRIEWLGDKRNKKGCNYSLIRRYRITMCNGRTYILTWIYDWIVDKKPPKIKCPKDVDLGCNPAFIPGPEPENLKVTDNCCLDTVYWLGDIVVTSKECKQVRLRRYVAIDCCGNRAVCEQKITWISDTTPPEIVECPEGKDLGCIPDFNIRKHLPRPSPRDVVTKDNCSEVKVTWELSDITVVGCEYSISYVYIVTDRCGNQSRCLQTFTWTADNEPPRVDCQDLFLGCNPDPEDIPSISDIQVADNCGAVTIEFPASSIKLEGCTTIINQSFIAVDQCGNKTKCERTIRYTTDTIPPVIDCPEEVDLGCNPLTIPGLDASRIDVKDNCGIADTLYAIVDYLPDSCFYKVGYLYTFIDYCGNKTSCQEVFRWTFDKEPPNIIECPENEYMGCWDQNGPNELPPPDMDSFIVDDACGEVTKSYQDGFDIVFNPEYCTASRVRRYIATDACGNQSDCWQTYIWTYDVTPPDIIQCAPDLDLGCISDLDSVPGPDNTDDIIAVDNCSDITTRWLSSESKVNGCEWEYNYLYSVEDRCGNETTCIQTIEFTYVDPEAPTLQIPEDMTVFCQVPAPPDYSGVCANESLELLYGFSDGCEDNNCTVYRYWLLTTCDGEQIADVQVITVICDITGESISISEDHGNSDSIKSGSDNSGHKVITNDKSQEGRNPRFFTELIEPGQLILYPNPATISITLKLDNSEQVLSNPRIYIYDQYGRIVKHLEPDHPNRNHEIWINDLPGGMYFIELVGEANRRWTRSFVKLD